MESSAQIFVPYKIKFLPVTRQEEWLMGRPPLPEILGQIDPVRAKAPIFNRYSLVARLIRNT